MEATALGSLLDGIRISPGAGGRTKRRVRPWDPAVLAGATGKVMGGDLFLCQDLDVESSLIDPSVEFLAGFARHVKPRIVPDVERVPGVGQPWNTGSDSKTSDLLGIDIQLDMPVGNCRHDVIPNPGLPQERNTGGRSKPSRTVADIHIQPLTTRIGGTCQFEIEAVFPGEVSAGARVARKVRYPSNQ
jgi:hypothetical protein